MFISGLGIALCIWLRCQCIRFIFLRLSSSSLNVHGQSALYRICSTMASLNKNELWLDALHVEVANSWTKQTAKPSRIYADMLLCCRCSYFQSLSIYMQIKQYWRRTYIYEMSITSRKQSSNVNAKWIQSCFIYSYFTSGLQKVSTECNIVTVQNVLWLNENIIHY